MQLRRVLHWHPALGHHLVARCYSLVELRLLSCVGLGGGGSGLLFVHDSLPFLTSRKSLFSRRNVGEVLLYRR